MTIPLVSVCIPSFNYGRYISDAIDSALSQHHPSIEVVVSDNGSTDATFDVLRKYADDPRVRVFRNDSNLGIARNMNAAIERATGKYIVMLSADDFLLPGHVQRSLARLIDRSDPVDIVYSGALFVDPVGTVISSRAIIGDLPMGYSHRNEFAQSLISCYICMPTMLIAKQTYQDLGGISTELSVAVDWEFVLRCAAAGKLFAHLDEPMTAIRFHDDQASHAARYTGTGKSFSEYLQLLERYITQEHAWRFSGYEHRIKAMLGALHTEAKTTELYAANPSLSTRTVKVMRDLDAWSVQPPTRPAEVPRVSIIMPTSGRTEMLENALRCLHEQTFASWEVIVVQSSGQSQDAWLRSLPSAKKMRYVQAESFMTPAAARNCGLQLARGEYITYLDDDNAVTPDHLAGLIDALDRSSADVAVASANLVINGYVAERARSRQPQARVSDIFRHTADRRVSFLANAVPLNAVMHSMAVVDRIGQFRGDFAMLEEWEFFLRLEQSEPVVFTEISTLDVHNTVGFAAQQFLQFAPIAYVQLMEIIYRLYPSPTPEIDGLRAMYMAELCRLFEDFALNSASVERMIDVCYRLAGRHARFTQPLTPTGSSAAFVSAATKIEEVCL